MDLIIKPTEMCNFKCTFCSSSDISDEHSKVLDFKLIVRFLRQNPDTKTLIINGGDPLMVSPDYYWKLIKFLDDNKMRTTLSFTTNLWAFYKKPDMWTELFKHKRVGVTTSFNYGNSRRITDTRVYTEDDFWKVSDLMLERVGYRPDFISVITEENEDRTLDHVYLAQKMGVECKLNYAMASGDQSKPYPIANMYASYCAIYDLGLSKWEYNTKQMMKVLNPHNKGTTCPLNRDCDAHIRALNPGGDYYSCGAFGDDKKYPIDMERDLFSVSTLTPLRNQYELSVLKDECLQCSLFDICNGCYKSIKDMKDHNMIEMHCKHMKCLEPIIKTINNACIV